MNKPMTTQEAYNRHLCAACRHSDIDCGYECVESSTCSVTCAACQERVWFTGNLQDQNPSFICPYCSWNQTHYLLGK